MLDQEHKDYRLTLTTSRRKEQTMYYTDNTYQGGKRQRESGALLFPAHPREIEKLKKEAELDKELEEIKELKSELEQLLKEAKGED